MHSILSRLMPTSAKMFKAAAKAPPADQLCAAAGLPYAPAKVQSVCRPPQYNGYVVRLADLGPLECIGPSPPADCRFRPPAAGWSRAAVRLGLFSAQPAQARQRRCRQAQPQRMEIDSRRVLARADAAYCDLAHDGRA